MEEYFVFDVEGKFTGEVLTTTEEEGWVFDELRDISSENIQFWTFSDIIFNFGQDMVCWDSEWAS